MRNKVKYLHNIRLTVCSVSLQQSGGSVVLLEQMHEIRLVPGTALLLITTVSHSAGISATSCQNVIAENLGAKN